MTYQMNIVYCTDFSKNSAHAFRQATFYAEATTSKLYVLHVIPGPYTAEETETAQHSVLGHPDMEKVLDHIETEYLANGDAKYEAVVRHGNETAEIVRFADSVDAGLIVIGSRGVGSLAGFFGGGGGVAEKVIKNSRVPVLVVPPE